MSDLTDLVERSGAEAVSVGVPPASYSAPVEPGAAPSSQTAAPPSSFDWRNHDGSDWTTPVKSQGICGSCWAFAAVGATEAAFDVASGDPGLNLNLSEQYLVADCAYGCCWGGNHGSALSFIRSEGIPDEACLPYLDGQSGGCSYVAVLQCNTTLCTYHEGSECSDYRCTATAAPIGSPARTGCRATHRSVTSGRSRPSSRRWWTTARCPLPC